jgi:hypothetical protein
VRNVRDVFAQRDWNTIVDADGNKLFGVEQLLADEIDGPAAAVLQGIRDESSFPLGQYEREVLALFMSAQLTRGRVIRENLVQSISEVNSMMLKVAAANYTDAHWIRAIGKVPTEQERQAFLHNEQHFEIKPTNAMLL